MKSTKKPAKKKAGKSPSSAKSSPRTPVSKKKSPRTRKGKGRGIQDEPRGSNEPNQDIDKRDDAYQNPVKRNQQDEVNEGVVEGEELNPNSSDLNTTEDEIGKRKLWL